MARFEYTKYFFHRYGEMLVMLVFVLVGTYFAFQALGLVGAFAGALAASGVVRYYIGTAR